MEGNKKKKIIVILLSIIAVLGIVLGVLVISSNKEVEPTPEEPTPVVEPEENKMDADLRQRYLDNKAISDDYIGHIVFDSGIIDLPFVQAEDIYDDDGKFYTFYDIDGNRILEEDAEYGCDDYACTGNDVYLWTYWETMEYDKMEHGGSVFMDYRNTLDDENIIIYGHHFSPEFDPERTRAFTCLENFVNEDYYKDNQYLSLILDNEIRKYQVAVVFKYDLNNGDDSQYYRTEYEFDLSGDPDPGYTEKYFKTIKELAYYDTGVELKKGDKTLTLQTCYSGQPDYREVIVCKLIDTIKYD